MIKLYDYKKMNPEDIFNRDLQQNDDIEAVVADIMADVRKRGDQALKEFSLKFDGCELEGIEVTSEEVAQAIDRTGEQYLQTLKFAAANIENYHKRQVRSDYVVTEREGVVLGQRVLPLKRVGIYVPGGTASYPSSVLMNAIPAKLAGVDQIIMVTPPDKEGKVADHILAAASVAGVDRIFKVGGAQAVAALVYGTQSVPKVDKIVGPGNIYVATAKRRAYGLVDIDMIAGPSEILVIADESCNPAFVAADLLSQAEHDPLAAAVLVTDSKKLAEEVQTELERQIPRLARSEIARQSVDANGKIILVDSIKQAIEISNMIAPEHLEICVEEPFALLNLVCNAGSVFLGKNVPEALGDYIAGPNHVLPTNGTARFSSALSVDDFVKKSSFLYYSEAALAQDKEHVIRFALQEGLQGHANSVAVRFGEEAKL